jgi:hypothetical protein
VTPGESERERTIPRDTDPTAFTAILESLIARVSGASAAALVDSLGETVDYAGEGDPFDLRVIAAHLQIVISHLERLTALGAPRWVVIRGSRKSVAASVLPDGYVLGLVLRPRAAFAISPRALEVCSRALAKEAGFGASSGGNGAQRGSWFDVRVMTDTKGRPTHLGAQRVAVEVLGAVVGLAVRERGFRVRTADGSELTLVREPKNWWYADAPA